MKIFSVRGATTVQSNTKPDIASATNILIGEVISQNGLDSADFDIVNCIISSTHDITAMYPATAVRESGRLKNAPLFSALEPDIQGSLPLCIRIMITATSVSDSFTPKHVYLNGAEKLQAMLTSK